MGETAMKIRQQIIIHLEETVESDQLEAGESNLCSSQQKILTVLRKGGSNLDQSGQALHYNRSLHTLDRVGRYTG